MSTAPASAAPSPEKVLRLGFTLDIQPGKIDEYIAHHASSRPEIVAALRGVGIRNLSLWNFENRLFYYCEYVGERDFEEAMEEYAKTPGVEEWEALMHTYQAKIPGTTPESDVWWQKCRPVYHQE